MAQLAKIKIQRVANQCRTIDIDSVVLEAEILFKLNGKHYRTFYCLPTHLEEMIRGHLVSEGICDLSDIRNVEIRSQEGGFEAVVDSCNVELNEIQSEIRVNVADIWVAVERLNERSILFVKTGGTHVAGLLNNHDSVFAEDTSRHRAMDKAIGLALQRGINIARSILVVSCRQTASTISKIVYSRIPIVASTSAVTSLAIESAQRYGITLIGFAREHRFNIYSHEERIIGSDHAGYESNQ